MKFQPSWTKLNKNSPSVQAENDYIIIILLNTENKTSILSLSPISCPGLSDACSALHSIVGTESTLHQQDLDVFSHSRSPDGDLQISTVTCIIELSRTIMYYWINCIIAEISTLFLDCLCYLFLHFECYQFCY